MGGVYDYILHVLKFKVGFDPGGEGYNIWEGKKLLLLWINDGLMAVFFFAGRARN